MANKTNTSISIASNALVLLGDQPIASFDEGSTGSMLAANLYETTYHAMLTETLWHFATRTQLLNKHTVKPTNGYSNRFALPADCLYVVQADTFAYEIYERDIYANADSITIEYIYPVAEVNMPAYFVKALEYNLASLFAVPLTGTASRAEYYRKLYEMELKRAKRADASQRPGYTMGQDRMINVRRTT